MEKIPKSNISYSPETNFNFARIFLNKIDNNILAKLYKLSQEKNIQNIHQIEKSKISKTPRNRNIIKILPIKSTFKIQKNIVPPININELSETRDQNINYTQIKPNLSYKLEKFNNYSKIIEKLNISKRDITLFSKKIRRKDINKKNSYLKNDLSDKISKVDLNYSLKDINNSHKPYFLPTINDASKFFHNETLKNALKKSAKIQTKD